MQHAKSHAGDFKGPGSPYRTWRQQVRCELNGGALLARCQAGRAPVVGMLEAAFVLETGSLEGARRQIVVAREREVDVARGAGLSV